MPKRGGGGQRFVSGGGSRFSALKDYHEHDDREHEHHRMRNTTRRVSFKQIIPPSKDLGMKRRTAEMAIRSRLEEDDEMGDFATTSSKFEERGGSRRKGSPIPKGKFGGYNKKLTPNTLGWYQVSKHY